MEFQIQKKLHDMKTPLTSLRLYTEAILRGDCGPITAKQREYLEDMYRLTGEMIEEVNKLPTKPKT
jgi:signal transduction histidine kinase